MKVAVIGGGFYGIMASLELAKSDFVKEVFLFDKGRSLMNAAGKYNQARLHLGFHYPRSKLTVKQCIKGFCRITFLCFDNRCYHTFNKS